MKRRKNLCILHSQRKEAKTRKPHNFKQQQRLEHYVYGIMVDKKSSLWVYYYNMEREKIETWAKISKCRERWKLYLLNIRKKKREKSRKKEKRLSTEPLEKSLCFRFKRSFCEEHTHIEMMKYTNGKKIGREYKIIKVVNERKYGLTWMVTERRMSGKKE